MMQKKLTANVLLLAVFAKVEKKLSII